MQALDLRVYNEALRDLLSGGVFEPQAELFPLLCLDFAQFLRQFGRGTDVLQRVQVLYEILIRIRQLNTELNELKWKKIPVFSPGSKPYLQEE